MPLPDQLSLLCIAIEEKARKEADSLVENARNRADTILESARQDMKQRLEQRLLEERENAAREASRITDAAELKARQFILRGKKEILSMLMEKASKRLAAMRSAPSYAGLLKTLAVRAVSGIPGDHAVLKVNSQDRDLLTPEMISALSSETGKEITLSRETASVTGGCIAYSADMRQMVDCSFEALLKEAEPALMELLAAEFVESGSAGIHKAGGSNSREEGKS